ncbi:MAG: PHP domain-containing protein [Christensenellaceae bacterium]
MYKYELHCHTARTSACSRLRAEEIVELFLANGYTGVFITDHFLNGNTTVNQTLPLAPYERKIEEFCKGYEEVKAAAAGRLDVFFGFEYSYLGTDVLCYGWKEEELKAFPEIMQMSMKEFCLFAPAHGAIAVQAHPFREDWYIDHIRLYPDCEGVETLNSSRGELCNRLGRFYAESYGKIQTGGSDIHHAAQKMLSGMAFEERLTSERHLVQLLRAGKGRILHQENLYHKP